MERLVTLALEHFELCRTPDEFWTLFKLNQTNITIISNAIQNCKVSNNSTIGQKRHLENLLGQLKSLRVTIRNKLKSGSGLQRVETPNVEWQTVASAFKHRVKTGVIINNSIEEPREFFDVAGEIFEQRLKSALAQRMPAIRVNVVLCGDYVKPQDPDVRVRKYFSTKNYEVLKSDDIQSIFHDIKDNVLTQMDDFEMEGSGYVLERIVNLAVNIGKYQPLRGSKYIKLPSAILAKRAVVNVKNIDDKCFIYALLSALYPTYRNPHRPSSYPDNFGEIFNLGNLTFPVKIRDIAKFEHLNPTISINVYGLNRNKVIGPLHHAKQIKENHINLLYLTEKGTNSHYCWIKNLSRLCRSQISKHTTHCFICDRCLNNFTSKQRLENHLQDCSRVDPVKVTLPQHEEAKLSFKNFQYNLRHPVVIYVDFECLVEPIDGDNTDDSSDDNDNTDFQNSYTKPYQKHVPYSVAYQVVCSIDVSLSHYKSYRGPNPQKWFVNQLRKETSIIEERLNIIEPMLPLSPEEQQNFDNTTACKFCLRPFDNDNVIKCRDHDHYSAKFRFALCQDCNLNYKVGNYIPIIAHNLSGYDMHFIITELDFDTQPISLLPITMENYISVSKKCGKYIWRFIDSFRFMGQSLDKLAKNLTDDMFKYTKDEFNENFQLMKRKGVLCYDYLNAWTKLEEPELPPKSEFYNKLTEKDVSNIDYFHAQTVWETFKIKTLGEYSDIYLKCDVLILCDIFEQFRNLCLNIYNLDPAHFYTGPSLAWNAALKKTKITLELLTDNDKILFIEKGIRGGLTQCSHRYMKANNEYIKDFIPSQPSNYLFYVDANNLYGYAMSQPLPYKGFEWVKEDIVDYVELKLKNFACTSPIPYSDYTDSYCMSYLFGDEIRDKETSFMLEVNLIYPKELHKTHDDLPFCPEHRTPPGSKYTKLMATNYDKQKYVIHIRNLFQCLQHGLKLEKIHRILKFEQKNWLKLYIDLNTNMRSKATNDFEKDFFKLMNNAVFGKTMENLRNHRIIKLSTSWKQAQKLIAKPNFRSFTIFKENLIAIELNKTVLKYNKPVYLGMAILDLSKLLMYSFHYEYVKNQFDHPKLLYTDTDSFIYSFKENIYEVVKQESMKGSEGFFDTSDYPLNNVYNIQRANKKVIGKFKDELKGKVLEEFIGLRSKMYAFKVFGEKPTLKAKGVSKTALKKRINFNSYYNSLFKGYIIYATSNTIRSKKHKVLSLKIKKKALDPADDKRRILHDGVSTLPWGNCQISEDPLDTLVNMMQHYI